MSLDDTLAPAAPADSAPTAPAPTPEPVAPAAETEAAAPEVSVDDELSKIWQKHNPARDETGKFAPRNPAAPEAPAEAPVEEAQPVEAEKPAEPAKPAVEPPRAWSAEQRAVWAKMPPEAQQLVAARETELHEIKSTVGRLEAEYRPIREMLSHQYVQSASGGDGPGFVRFLLESAHAMDQNPAGMIKRLAESYGVDLGTLYDPLEAPPNAEAARLARQNALLQGQMEAQQRQRAAEEQAARGHAVQTAIDQFLSQHPDANEFVADIAAEVRALQIDHPNKPHAELLKEAYERAAWANPQVREKRLAEVRKAEEAKRIAAAKEAAAKARTAASVNVQGSPSRAVGEVDLESTLRGIWRKNHAR